MEVVRRMAVNVTSYCTAPLDSAARPTTNWSPDRVLRIHCAKTQQQKPAGLSSRAMKPLSGSVRLTFTSLHRRRIFVITLQGVSARVSVSSA